MSLSSNTLCMTEIHREIADNSEIGCLQKIVGQRCPTIKIDSECQVDC
jgi:hypothetical protein